MSQKIVVTINSPQILSSRCTTRVPRFIVIIDIREVQNNKSYQRQKEGAKEINNITDVHPSSLK